MDEGKKKPGKYRTTNWAAYNAALKSRGSLTVWLDRDMQWLAVPTGKPGRHPTFSDAAIQFCLSIKCLFPHNMLSLLPIKPMPQIHRLNGQAISCDRRTGIFPSSGSVAALAERITRRAAMASLACWKGAWGVDASPDIEGKQQLGRSWVVPQGAKLVLRPEALGLTLPGLVDAIGDWIIPSSSSVTIQMPDGRHQINKPITYRGRDGARVRIIGAPADPTGCTLLWNQTGDLFFSPAGVVLGLVDGFTITHEAKSRRGNGCAFLAEASGSITCGPNVRIQNFYYGFQARLGGSIKCQGTQCTGAGDAAYFAFNGGHIDASNALADGSRDDPRRLGSGFVAEYGGSINAEGATARGNALAGFQALSNGVIRAYGATAERNGRAGFFARTGGTIVAHAAVARNNCGPGILVEGPHATFEAGTRSVSANDSEASNCRLP